MPKLPTRVVYIETNGHGLRVFNLVLNGDSPGCNWVLSGLGFG